MPSLVAAARIDADAVFQHLLERSIYDGGMQQAQHWQVLLEIGPASGDRSGWFDRLAEVASEVVGDFTRLDAWILDAGYRAEIDARLEGDRLVLESLVMMHEMLKTTRRVADYDRDDPTFAEDFPDFVETDEFGRNMTTILLEVMQQRPPRFLDTIDVVKRILERESLLTANVRTAIDEIREAMLPGVSAARQAYSAADRARAPTDWVTA
jgi:hypothetical protein